MKRDRIKLEFSEEPSWGPGDWVQVHCKRFSTASTYCRYNFNWHPSNFKNRKELRNTLENICKNNTTRIIMLRHENVVIKEFSRLMIKHYGKELVMV